MHSIIAVDCMGGDFAPRSSLGGALAAAKKNIPVLLFGPQEYLAQELTLLDESWQRYPLRLSDASEVISMNDDPVKAVRKKQKSSLVQAVLSLKANASCAVVSAGNSGAVMTASMLFLGRQRGVKRPAIAGFLPTQAGHVLCLDLGANNDCKPHHLVTFAELGCAYFMQVKGEMHPTVGLLSNGSEPRKGCALVKKTYDLLTRKGSINFIGNVEPGDVFRGGIDIIVCDGFAGNILLKSAEGVAQIVGDMITHEVKGQDKAVVQLFLKKIRQRFDWARQGGALLLGVKGTVVVAHGRSCKNAIENAILFAWKSAQQHLGVSFGNEKISAARMNHNMRSV